MVIEVNGVNYHVRLIGQGEPLLLLHGFTGEMSTWEAIIPYLGDKFQLVLVDILGHGKTESPLDDKRYQIEEIAEDMKAILMNLNLNKVNILGYSMGGRLALAFTILFPEMVNKLILESASPGLRTEEEREARRFQDESLAERILENGLKSFVQYWTNIPLFQTQKKLSESIQLKIEQQRLQNNPIGLANSLKGMGTGSMPSFWEKLSFLEMPVLIITGSLDNKFCKIAEEMKNVISDAKHETILSVGHAIHVEDSQKFGTIIKEFLSN
ncbi:2-succinyl-6-hydroxy-2,4-cyclohexadiene-1-carboxylate synthase [Heyndrickxia sp. NPDC080065]|uniref:2-succinyl-6-hydroxy-2, 4-cyclohexadiene-1-carboxylate synthase n=1 Tax=Heyndrickxia sp. NPDC080065 TaxID=3390568 RepID=UPI003D0729EF